MKYLFNIIHDSKKNIQVIKAPQRQKSRCEGVEFLYQSTPHTTQGGGEISKPKLSKAYGMKEI